MQYLLTKEEYDALVSRKTQALQLEKSKLQKLCTKICNEMPVMWEGWGYKDLKPWTCMLDAEEHDWYCDNCPVTAICPYPAQEYSK